MNRLEAKYKSGSPNMKANIVKKFREIICPASTIISTFEEKITRVNRKISRCISARGSRRARGLELTSLQRELFLLSSLQRPKQHKSLWRGFPQEESQVSKASQVRQGKQANKLR
ncbi:hypothetical protein Scep_023841 [Stephania cephalantha]|uniref:Uncharacterized protein n=1 Tax=Stephania cephalantha TaxID=152367 RepID=A0AAP0HXQ2_9MAGN